MGTIRAVLLDASETVVLLLREAFASVTVHVVLVLEVKLDAAHSTEDKATGACRLIVAVWVAPLSVAETVALPFAEIVPAAAVKLAVVELAATVTEAGTVKATLLDASETVVLPLRVAFESVTVQVLVALEARVAGEH